ncbi:class I SAM-dependent methyltransferase [Streptomyces oryzae]|uniref:class I SAM-dependent methyltransferase n=1 Tax=Streptomyces oryzae TaxID=1434886 RepID=UPI0024695A2F|nr:class I SAM-dependent methyltransferase [Streptomyces oryzae]
MRLRPAHGAAPGTGYVHVVGVDPSYAMIERGLREHPRLALRHQVELPLPDWDGSYDAALLFAVLTCVPDDAAQSATLTELARLLRPDGVVYISEVPLQRDARNAARYEQHHTAAPLTWGHLPAGGWGRHLHHRRRRTLPAPAARAAAGPAGRARLCAGRGADRTAPTLNGHRAECLQLVARRRADG